MKKHLGATLPGTLFHMCKGVQFYLNPTSMWSIGMDIRRVALIWKIMMNPHDIKIKNISNVFFDTVLRVSNMRYFKSQELSHDSL
jgi:hypothetical protein